MNVRPLKVYKRIKKEIEEKIRAYPKYADLHNQMGLMLAVEGDLESAQKEFDHALQLNPQYVEAKLNLGFLFLLMKRWKEAETIFLSEGMKGPESGVLQHILGVIYVKTGREKETLQCLRKALKTDHHCQKDYHTRGIWRDEQLFIEKMRREDGRTIPRRHFYQKFHTIMGLYLAKGGHLAQALRELKKAEKFSPDSFLSHFHLGLVYYYTGDDQRAIMEFKKAIKINPEHGLAYAYLSYVYGVKKQTRQALECMEKAVALNPRYADLHYNLALLYSDQGRYREAISELKKAIRINPNYLFARVNLGVLYEEQKKWKAAKSEYEWVLKVTPEDEYVQKRLEKISNR